MTRFSFAFMIALVGLMAGSGSSGAQDNFGSFKGKVVAEFLPDGRMMKLILPFTYVDPKRRVWEAPAGMETDGATIPRALWVTYPPFTGKYRLATVIHDFLCQSRVITWTETHEIFYLAVRATGETEVLAKTMYGAVYLFGPRWGPGVTNRGPDEGLPPDRQLKLFEDMKAWVERENPSLEEIARRTEAGGPFDARP